MKQERKGGRTLFLASRDVVRAALLLLLGFLLSAQESPSAREELRDKRILILTSYEYGRPGVEVLLRGFLSALEGAGIGVNQVYTEHLDLERASDPAFQGSLGETLRQKYASRRLDLVYVVEQPALKFFLQNLVGVAPGAPVILARAILPEGGRASDHRFVRQLIAYDVEGTLRRAMELFPDARRVLFVAGSTESDRAVAAQAALAMEPWKGKVASEDTTGLSLDQVKARIRLPAPGTFIVVLPFNRDSEGRTAVQMEVAFEVSAVAGAPVFTLWENAVGRGAVGGSVTNFQDVGRQAGEFAIELVAGRKLLTSAVTDLPARSFPKFDWRQIQRWHGDPARLPGESLFINRPATLWEQYRRTVIITALFLLAQTLLIALLLVERRLRNRAQKNLLASEARFRILVEQAPEAIIVFDPVEERLVDANANAERLFGVSRDQLRRSGVFAFYSQDQPDGRPSSETFAENAKRALAGEHVMVERAIHSADGRDLICEVRLANLPADPHPLLRASYIDITDRKRLEAERGELTAQLHQSQKLESLGSLAGGVAHDMNNVLGAILGLASANQQGHPVESPTWRAFDTISRAATRGGQMVKSLLSFARNSLSEEAELDLNELLREEVRLLERTTLSRVRLEMDLAPDLHRIRGDASAIAHSFMNLCVNAVDAMPEQGTLTLRTRNLDEDWIEVQVEDTGCGMSKSVLENALDPFFTTKPQGRGTGLGLSIVYRTVKAHRGRMDLQSESGLGTIVTMRFPVSASPVMRESFREAPAEGIATPLTVLLADDDELVRSSSQMVLEMLGHRSFSVASGEEALAELEKGLRPDVMILDMNMPGLGGAGTLPRVRALRPELPVLLATGRADQPALDLVAAHPGVTLLSKPFTVDDLMQLLAPLGHQVEGRG